MLGASLRLLHCLAPLGSRMLVVLPRQETACKQRELVPLCQKNPTGMRPGEVAPGCPQREPLPPSNREVKEERNKLDESGDFASAAFYL